MKVIKKQSSKEDQPAEKSSMSYASLKASTSKKLGNLLNFMNTAKRQFVFAVEQARITGTLLGKFLTSSSFADNRAVSLIGYSLGGVASFNCMRTVMQEYEAKVLRAGKVFNDVNIWAGAYVINVTKQESEILEKAAFCRVVNGNLNNLYSKKDTVLKYAFTQIFKKQ